MQLHLTGAPRHSALHSRRSNHKQSTQKVIYPLPILSTSV
jgi:hypothetical protein